MRKSSVDRLYDILEPRLQVLRDRFGGRFPFPRDLHYDKRQLSTPGVYFFFEHGETRSTSAALRIVRVGTHGDGASSIESRITNEHAVDFGRSIFRRHLGSALLLCGEYDAVIGESERASQAVVWYSSRNRIGLHCLRNHLPKALHPLHTLVTDRINAMPVGWIHAASQEQRNEIERQLIRTLSNRWRSTTPVNPPSANWLGRYAKRPEVGASGLWNVLHTRDTPRHDFLDELAAHLTKTLYYA